MTDQPETEVDPPLVIGEIKGHFGIKGWVKVFSYTRPPEELLTYRHCLVNLPSQSANWKPVGIQTGKQQGKGLILKLTDYENREQTDELIGGQLAIDPTELPVLSSDEYYWTDLIDLKVINQQEIYLGKVDHLVETGANDVMIVIGDREHAVPWLSHVVQSVDLESGVMIVDWDEDFSSS